MLEGYKFEKVEKGYEVSSPSNSVYLVRVTEGVVGSCNCWAYRRAGNCKHVDAVKEIIPVSPKGRISRRFCEGIIDFFKYNYFSPNSVDYCVAGSYRRMKPDSKDLDIIILGNTPEIKSSLLNFLASNFPNGNEKSVTDVIARGIGNYIIQWYVPVTETQDIMMDFHLVDPADFESEVLFFTGSMEHNIKMRSIAKKKGYKLNQYGLWKDEECLTKKELEIFEILEIPYVEPKDR